MKVEVLTEKKVGAWKENRFRSAPESGITAGLFPAEKRDL